MAKNGADEYFLCVGCVIFNKYKLESPVEFLTGKKATFECQKGCQFVKGRMLPMAALHTRSIQQH